MRKSSTNQLTVLDALVSFLCHSVLGNTRAAKRFYSFNTLSLFLYQALCPLSLLLYCDAWLFSHKALSDSSSVIVTYTLSHQWIPAFWVLAVWTTCLVSCDKHWILLHCNPHGQVEGPQPIKNPPAMQGTQETRVQSLSQEDPLEEEMQPTPGFLPTISRG